jgi:hypothetical protein
VVTKLGRPVQKVMEVRLRSLTHVAGRSVPRASALFRRVRFPATPGLVLGRVGRVESATQWELASAAAFSKPALDLADGTVSSMCRLVSGPIGLRLGGNGRRDVRRVGGLPSARRAESLVPGTARGRSPSTEFGLWY